MTLKNLRLGIAIGHGTGRELTVVFKKVIQELARQHSLQVDFIESSRIYHSYHSLTTSRGDKDLIQHIAEETTQDAEEYRKFCETATANGIAAIFRTAIHAQSLYLVRGQLKAVKIEHFNLGDSNALLFIRDEAQGFYAGENEYHDSQHSITRTSPFTRSTFDQILEYALERAKEEWGVENLPKAVTLVYKFHLFDGVFQAWAPHWQRRFGIELDFIQPDTMNRNLMASGIQGRRIIIAGNEYADIIQPVFLKWFSNATIETMCAENVYLSPSLHRLSEYQTVHGSADAIAGQRLVNPFATIRAAAAILERHGGCPGVGFQSQTERAIQTLLMKKLTTPDQGGSCSTDAVLGHFLRAIADPATIDDPSIGRDIATGPIEVLVSEKTAVVIVDYQNDFIASTPSHVVAELSNTMPRLVQYARHEGSEVIFVRFLGNSSYQGPSWRCRNALLGKPQKCVEGTWGAELGSGITPHPGERVFDKKALFDSFLVPEFSEYVSEQGFEHLVLAGLYSDVCVDATARTAFQKGLWVTVVEDCTTALHSNHSDHLKFMEKVYGARINVNFGSPQPQSFFPYRYSIPNGFPQSGFAIVTPASRGIGFAFARYLLQHADLPIIATTRRDSDSLRHRLLGGIENSAAEERLSVFDVDVTEESTVRSLADNIKQTHPQAPLRLALTVPGILHVEKSPAQIDAHAALESLKVNTIGPMLLMKHLTPFLPTRSSPLFDPCDGEVKLPQHAIYAMMAARVGSVSDNRMGGWYSYRASKAAVFQLAKTLDLYLEGKCADRAISLAMHPGTVKTDFTESYQDGREMLSAEESAERLLGVLGSLGLEGRGRCWDWKGCEVRP